MTKHDVIIVGGGHNGLTCAAYLARAGKKVLVLERRDRIGGAAFSDEVFPGFRFSVFSYVVSLLRPEIIRELELPRHGLQILPLESTLTPLPNGDRLVQWSDHDQNRAELARHSPRDAEAYDEFGLLLHRMTDLSDSAKLVYKAKHKIRFVTAASLFDGHDASINIMRRRSRSTTSVPRCRR